MIALFNDEVTLALDESVALKTLTRSLIFLLRFLFSVIGGSSPLAFFDLGNVAPSAFSVLLGDAPSAFSVCSCGDPVSLRSNFLLLGKS